MLSALRVRNLVVARDVDIEFGTGLSVLTGETGAGKSVLVDALALALGERAESRLVRAGAERAEVVASFDISALTALAEYLTSLDIEHDGDCVLRRTLTREGRSRAWCNGTPVALGVLRDIAARLVDIHAQHAGQRLLNGDEQRRLLDAYGGIAGAARAVYEAWRAWHTTAEQLAALERDGADGARAELLAYQVGELADAGLSADELDTIEDRHRDLANASAHRERLAAVRAALDDDEAGAAALLGRARASARELARSMSEAANLGAALEQAGAALDEALSELADLEDRVRVDPDALDAVDRRLGELHALARKHQVELGELKQTEDRLAGELARLSDRQGERDALGARLNDERATWQKHAAKLSRERGKVAARMGAEIGERLLGLGMPHGRFVIEVEELDDADPQPHGRDRVTFLVSTNPESTPDRINRVASGGELSRIALSIQAATASLSGVPVVVYDEVDTGIGGNTANIVGRSLREVAAHTQVICITHSPQVASAGDHHLVVDKQVIDGESESRITLLDRKAREREIARMLGAAADRRTGVAHARELLEAAGRN